jgi:hypothetical protein
VLFSDKSWSALREVEVNSHVLSLVMVVVVVEHGGGELGRFQLFYVKDVSAKLKPVCDGGVRRDRLTINYNDWKSGAEAHGSRY